MSALASVHICTMIDFATISVVEVFNHVEYVSNQLPRLCTSSMLHQAWMKILYTRLVMSVMELQYYTNRLL